MFMYMYHHHSTITPSYKILTHFHSKSKEKSERQRAPIVKLNLPNLFSNRFHWATDGNGEMEGESSGVLTLCWQQRPWR